MRIAQPLPDAAYAIKLEAALKDVEHPPPQLHWFKRLRGTSQLAYLAFQGFCYLFFIMLAYKIVSLAWVLSSFR